MKNISFKNSDKSKFLKILCPLSVLILCVLSFLLVKRIENMGRAAEWVNKTNFIRQELSETNSRLTNAETEHRGFLLTKDSSFYALFTKSSNELHTHLNNLDILLSHNPAMKAPMKKLRLLVNNRLDLLQQVLDEHKDKVLIDQTSSTNAFNGKAAMGAVDAQIQLMDSQLGQLLQQRSEESHRYIITTPLYAAIVYLLALLLIIYAFYNLLRQLKLSTNYLNQSQVAEEKARMANFLLENAEQITRSGSWKWNSVHGKREHSRNLFRLFGYEPNSFEPGMYDFLHMIDEDGRQEMISKLEQDMKTGEVSTSSFWITRKDGQRRYFRCISHFGKNDKGEDIIIGTTQDITETYLLKQESEQHARFNELVVENNVDMIAAFDKELRVTVWNKAYEDIFGVPKRDILGKRLTDVFPYLENDVKTIYLKAALEGKETIQQEFRYFKNQKTGEISIIPLKDEIGNITGVLTNIHDITAIKEAERLLKESNLKFEQAEEAGKIGSASWNLASGAMTWSKNLYRVFGYEPGSVSPSLGLLEEFIHPDDVAEVMQIIKQYLNMSGFPPLHFRVKRKDGEIRYVKTSAVPVKNEKGETVLFCSVLDVTEEELLKQQLQERNQLVESLIENSADMIEVIDTGMHYTVWNKANEQQFGLSKEEVLGKNIVDVFPGLRNDKRMEFINQGLKGNPTYRKEQPCLNGRKTADFSYIPLRNADGSIMGLLIMAHDITERIKAAEKLKRANDELHYRNQALREAYAFNRHITDLAPNGIYVYDKAKGVNVFFNKHAQELYGYNETELEEMGHDFVSRIIHPDDLIGLFEKFKQYDTAADDYIMELEYRVRNKEGQYRYMFTREAIFKRNENGVPEQFIGVTVDVTDIKMAEKELREKNLALQQSNEELASFNYIASHDLQEPLRKIQTFGNFLEETETGLTDQGKSSLKRMQMAAARMRTLINDLLAFSRVSMVKEEMEQVDLNEVLEQAKSSLRTALNEKGARIDGCELPKVQGVSFQLQQLFENIIGNAVKYCEPGQTPVVTITTKEVSTEQAEALGLLPGWTYHCISLQDNGIGFEQQYADKIFELFQRLHTKSEYPGTGLGLAICKKIVQNHGGHIQAVSNPGDGAVFEIFLPAENVFEIA
ncbi:PAS domain S-box protein [Chitinophagaceae bacterium LB-8]|uniref:histidine kinase n=1 Tax=Paraflavisolibacter caeni TaxID=2982496 RepID=A0A9X2Y1Z5_9BACT|nr:PAS domain S-box protein [Paraflavisolibacter caeni]MCU7552033.1 PAS domain S-box protein [Paraflavisolibacter caeni]